MSEPDVRRESLDESLASLELTIQRHLSELQSLKDQHEAELQLAYNRGYVDGLEAGRQSSNE